MAHLPVAEVWVIVAPKEAASGGEGRLALRPHGSANPEQQCEKGGRDDHQPEHQQGPEDGVEAAVLFLGAAELVEVGHEVAAPLPGEHADVVRLALFRLEDRARDRGEH